MEVPRPRERWPVNFSPCKRALNVQYSNSHQTTDWILLTGLVTIQLASVRPRLRPCRRNTGLSKPFLIRLPIAEKRSAMLLKGL